MDQERILHLLGEHRADVQRFGVKSLALFGSMARNEAREGSDVDLMVEFAPPVTFARYMDLKFFLEDLLGCRVDLTTRKALKDRVRVRVEKEAVRVPGL